MAQLAVVSHWYHLVQGLSYSPQTFYESLEEAVASWEVRDIKMSRVSHPEGGMFSGTREYVRVQRKDHVFECCAAPFGSGFFVSWWLLQKQSLLEALAEIPLVGLPIRLFVRPLTYFTLDTALMFQSAVSGAVGAVLEGIVEGTGLRMPSELEQKPIMREFFSRR